MLGSFDETQQRFSGVSKVNPHLTRLGGAQNDFEFTGNHELRRGKCSPRTVAFCHADLPAAGENF